VAASLGADLEALAHVPEPRPVIDDFVRTALVHGVLSGELSTAALTSDELSRFASQVRAGIDEETRGRLAQALGQTLDHHEVLEARDALPELYAGWWQDLESTFAQTEAKLDLRFVGGVLTAAHKD
jgi:hypothetical protein